MLVLTLTFGGAVSHIQAQSEDAWLDPNNLSNSGSASDPVFVLDADGIFHVLWRDEFAGLIYVAGDGTEWDVPSPIVLPSTDVVPFLIADPNGIIHALWRDEESRLFYSRVRESAFSSPSNWSPRELISDSALDFDVAIDDNGDLHLSYVNPLETEESPAGVYYLRLREGFSTWLAPRLLYESSYFRSLDLVSSNVDISTTTSGDDTRIFVAWDNRPRERVFLTLSDDNGGTWSLPIEVDKPDEDAGNSSSSNIIVDAQGDQILLLWQGNRSGSSCEQFYQYSTDGGNTWSSRLSMFEGFVICPNEIQFIPIEDGTLLMLNGIEAFLQAWDGENWSEPQLQQPLSAFVDPDTQKLVDFGCQQAIVPSNFTLFVLGCDEDIGKDIWLTKRQLHDIPEWFPEEAVWSPVFSVDKSDRRVSAQVLVSDGLNRMHAIWSLANPTDPDGLGKMLYYARWEDGQWSRPEMIITTPDGKNEQPAAAISAQDQLYLVWSGGIDGEIYFSNADADQAVVSTSWSNPIRLPSPTLVGSAPSIIVDPDGVIYVAYAIPLNENRGIYLVRSEDEGQTWTEPVVVFNARSVGWSMVDDPKLTITDNGHLHILWTRSTLPSGQGPLSLNYSSSNDGGESWSNPQTVVENPVVWSRIVGVGEQSLQRVWQEVGTIGTTFWHEQSFDNGESWNRIVPVSVFGETVSTPSLFRDSAGRLHLILAVREGQKNFIIQHWLYDGQRWSAERNLEVEFPIDVYINSIVGSISDRGDLGVLLANLFREEESNLNQYQLNFYNRSIEVPNAFETADQQVSSTPQINAPTASAKQPTNTSSALDIEPTITPIVFPDDQGQSRNTGWLAIVGPAAIGFIILIVILIIFRGFRKWR
jgi:hypothetical protein